MIKEEPRKNFGKLLYNRNKYPTSVLESFENMLAESIFEQVVITHKAPPDSFGVLLDQDRRTHQCILRIESDQPEIRALVNSMNHPVSLRDRINGIKPLQMHAEGKTVEYRADSLLQLVKTVNQWLDPAQRIGEQQLLPLEVSEVGRTSSI